MDMLLPLLARGFKVALENTVKKGQVIFTARVHFFGREKSGEGVTVEEALVKALTDIMIADQNRLGTAKLEIGFWANLPALLEAYAKAERLNDCQAYERIRDEAMRALQQWNTYVGMIEPTFTTHEFAINGPLRWIAATMLPWVQQGTYIAHIESDPPFCLMHGINELHSESRQEALLHYAEIPQLTTGQPNDEWTPYPCAVTDGEYIVFCNGQLTWDEYKSIATEQSAWGPFYAEYRNGWRGIFADESKDITHVLRINLPENVGATANE